MNTQPCLSKQLGGTTDALEMVTGKKLHRSAINRYWKHWGYTRKKDVCGLRAVHRTR